MNVLSEFFGGGDHGGRNYNYDDDDAYNSHQAMGEDDARKHYEDLYLAEQPRHQSSLTHEGLAAAAGFAAMHAYEAHVRATGKEVSHGKMKEILASIAAAEVDKLAETKGLDWVDRHKAHKMAAKQAHHLANRRYGAGNSGYNYVRQSGGGPSQEYDFRNRIPFGSQGCGSYGWYDQRFGGGPGFGGGGFGGGFGGGGYGGGYGGPGGFPPQQGGYGGGEYGGPGGFPPQQGGYYPPPPQGFQGEYGGGYGQPQPQQGYYQPNYGPPPGPPQGGYYDN